MSMWIGVDVGGTNIVCGAVDESGTVKHILKRPTDAKSGSAAVLDRLAEMIRAVSEKCGSDARIGGAGVGIPGLVDPQAGISKFASNLQWRDVPVVAELERRLNIPVYMDNDVRMYVYGESTYGAGRNFRHVLGLTIGTGIAAAVVQDGALLYGHRDMAGELGHGPLDGLDLPCGCGLRGCLETVASATGMVKLAKQAIASGQASILTEWYPGDRVAELTAASLSQAMDAGDPLAAGILRNAGEWTGRALVPAVHLLSPEIVIIGGGGALAGERLLEPMREALLERLLPDFRKDLQLMVAERNEDAGIVGSAMQARLRHSK